MEGFVFYLDPVLSTFVSVAEHLISSYLIFQRANSEQRTAAQHNMERAWSGFIIPGLSKYRGSTIAPWSVARHSFNFALSYR